MQISTSVGVVQDILISLSFQKNTKLIADPSRSQDQPAGICVNALRRNWRVAHHCGVPERVRPMCLSARSLIDKSALIAACSMRQAREATTSISRWPSGDLSMFARIFRASQGTRWKSYSYSASISNLRGAGRPAALSAAARRPAFRLPCSRCLALVPPLGSLEMTSVFPCFCPSSY